MTNNHFPEQQQQQQQEEDPDPMTIIHLSPPPPVHDMDGSRPSPRPPSYKLDTRMDLDALETDLQQRSVQSQHQKLLDSKWRHQFYGTPLVFWLVVFVLIGIVSLFIPPHLPFIVALTLWLPLVLYVMALFLFHYVAYQSPHQDIQDQLATIRRYRQRVLTRVSEPPAEDLYFLYATSDQYTHPVITLLPPPPSYQRMDV